VRAQFAAALHRNEALRLNLQMSVISVTLGALAVVSGTFGMNLEPELPFWSIPGVLPAVCGGMVVGGAVLNTAMSSYTFRKLSPASIDQEAAGLGALSRVLDDMPSMNFALKSVFQHLKAADQRSDMQELTKMDFLAMFEQNKVRTQDVEALFDLLDVDCDGVLKQSELHRAYHGDVYHKTS